MDHMKTIGLVGGVASGKSLVAKMFAELGAGLLDADRTGHDVLANDPDVKRALVERWGPSILAADGTVDRSGVAACVFASDDRSERERRFLEELLHPRIRVRLEEQRRQFAAEGRPAVVLDAPLLLEAGWAPMCDIVVMVDSAQETRLDRARQRDWSDAEFARREAAQWPVEQKRRSAHVTLANEASPDALRAAVRGVWDQVVAP
jgi:dephospho-CoA kinase